MINLLPVKAKENIKFAKRNAVLLRWMVGCFAAVVGIAIVVVTGMAYLNQIRSNVNNSVTTVQSTLASENYTAVQQKISSISGNLRLMVNVLSQEVLFSAMLKQIGTIMPQGTILTGLDITQAKGGLELQAAATSYTAASQIQVNLQDPNNKLFSKADIVSIQCGGANSSISKTYPCKADIRAQFVAKNPFLFINYQPGNL